MNPVKVQNTIKKKALDHLLRPFSRKIPFIILLILCIGLFINQASQCFSKYFKYETSISLDVQSTKSATFPSLTVCPDFHTSYKRDVLKSYGMQVDDMRGRIFFPKLGQMNLTQFFEQITYSLKDTINYLSITTGARMPGTNYTVFVFGDKNYTKKEKFSELFSPLENITWRTQYYLLYGRCYTLEVPIWLRELKILDVSLETKLNTFLFFHHPGQFLSTDTKSKIPGIIGHTLFIDVEHDVTYNLAREPYFEKSDGHALSSCREYKEIDYDDCIDDSLATEMGEIFNCTMPFLRPDSLYEECRLDLISEEARRHILDKYQDYYFETVRNAACIQSCSMMSVYFGYPFVDQHTSTTKAFIKMYFKSTIHVRRSSIAYSVLSLIAELGGYMGLFLGVSCLNLYSIFVKILDQLETQKKLTNVVTTMVEPVPKPDMDEKF